MKFTPKTEAKRGIKLLVNQLLPDQSPAELTFTSQATPSENKQQMNGLINERSFERISQIQLAFSLSIGVHLMLQFVYFELDVSNHTFAEGALWISALSGMICCGLTTTRHSGFNHFLRIKNEETSSAFGMFLNIIVFLVMPYPYLNNEVVSTYSDDSGSMVYYNFKFNYLMVIVSNLKLGYLVAAVLLHSHYMQPRSSRIARMYGTRSDYLFTAKSIFKDRPFTSMLAFTLTSILMFSYALRIAQHETFSASRPSSVYQNMIWLTVITMTSVGYGDYSPATPIGRLIACLCVIWGGFIVSVMVVVNTNTFTMTRRQSESLLTLKKLQTKRELRGVAGEYIRTSLWRLWLNNKYRRFESAQTRQRQLMKLFRGIRRQIDMTGISSVEIDLFNEFERQFDKAFGNVQILKENNLAIIDYLSDQFIFPHKYKDKERNSKRRTLIGF